MNETNEAVELPIEQDPLPAGAETDAAIDRIFEKLAQEQEAARAGAGLLSAEACRKIYDQRQRVEDRRGDVLRRHETKMSAYEHRNTLRVRLEEIERDPHVAQERIDARRNLRNGGRVTVDTARVNVEIARLKRELSAADYAFDLANLEYEKAGERSQRERAVLDRWEAAIRALPGGAHALSQIPKLGQVVPPGEPYHPSTINVDPSLLPPMARGAPQQARAGAGQGTGASPRAARTNPPARSANPGSRPGPGTGPGKPDSRARIPDQGRRTAADSAAGRDKIWRTVAQFSGLIS